MECERGERTHAVGHIVGALVLSLGHSDRLGFPGHGQQIEAGVLQRPSSGTCRIRTIRPAVAGPRVALFEQRAELLPDAPAQRASRPKDRIGIDLLADLAGDIGFRRHAQHLRDEGELQIGIR